MEFSRHPVC
jgi:hypothetical protein